MKIYLFHKKLPTPSTQINILKKCNSSICICRPTLIKKLAAPSPRINIAKRCNNSISIKIIYYLKDTFTTVQDPKCIPHATT
jgi:hypothetical protein